MLIALIRPRYRSLRDLWSHLGTALLRHRSRQSLRNLDAHLLRDIGLSHQQALSEANRPLWDAPEHWASMNATDC